MDAHREPPPRTADEYRIGIRKINYYIRYRKFCEANGIERRPKNEWGVSPTQDCQNEIGPKYRSYGDYLLSDGWKVKRWEREIIDGCKCQKCGEREKLVVHHLTYDRAQHENMDD